MLDYSVLSCSPSFWGKQSSPDRFLGKSLTLFNYLDKVIIMCNAYDDHVLSVALTKHWPLRFTCMKSTYKTTKIREMRRPEFVTAEDKHCIFKK